jgi:hypothetical protein
LWRIQQVQKLKEWQQKKLQKQELKQKQKQKQLQLKQAAPSAPCKQFLPLLVLDSDDDDQDEDDNSDEPQIPPPSAPSRSSVETSAAPGVATQSELGSSPAEPGPVGTLDSSSLPIGEEEDDEDTHMRAVNSSVVAPDDVAHDSQPPRSPSPAHAVSSPSEPGDGAAAAPSPAVGQLSEEHGDVSMDDASKETDAPRQGSGAEATTAAAGVPPSQPKSALTPPEPAQCQVTASPSPLRGPEGAGVEPSGPPKA